jgi:protein gp37
MRQAARIERMGGADHYVGLTEMVKGKPVWTGRVALASEKTMRAPLRRKKPRKIFVNSMSDLFHESVPDEWIDRIFVIAALSPQHIFQILTKRPKRMRDYVGMRAGDWQVVLPEAFAPGTLPISKHGVVAHIGVTTPEHRSLYGAAQPCWPLPNVWLGVTAEDQTRADERIPDLLATPAAARFVSCEPMLGAILPKRWLPTMRQAKQPDGTAFLAPQFFMTRCENCGWVGSSEMCGTDSYGDDSDVYCPACRESIRADDFPGLDWVICGGESGPGARPMHPDWARSLRDQCAAAGTPFFFKQRGEWTWTEDPMSPLFAEDEDAPNHPDDWREKDRGVICLRKDGSRCDGYSGRGEEFVYRVGKHRAGRLLDGREHNDFPEAK